MYAKDVVYNSQEPDWLMSAKIYALALGKYEDDGECTEVERAYVTHLLDKLADYPVAAMKVLVFIGDVQLIGGMQWIEFSKKHTLEEFIQALSLCNTADDEELQMDAYRRMDKILYYGGIVMPGSAKQRVVKHFSESTQKHAYEFHKALEINADAVLMNLELNGLAECVIKAKWSYISSILSVSDFKRILCGYINKEECKHES